MSALSTDDLVRLRDSIPDGPWESYSTTSIISVRTDHSKRIGSGKICNTAISPKSVHRHTGWQIARAIALVPDLLDRAIADAETIAAQEAELIRLRGEVEAMREALVLHQAWSDSEDAGPDYGALARDTHPDGDRIWRQWWDGNIDLCARAQDATRAALGLAAPTTGESHESS